MPIRDAVEITAWNTPFSSLPNQVKDAFTVAEREVYEIGAAPILTALKATEEVELNDIAGHFDQDQPVWVHVENLFSKPCIWFSLSNVKLKHEVRVRVLSETKHVSTKSPRFNRLFRCLSGLTAGTPHFPKVFAPYVFSPVKYYDSPCAEVIIYENGDRLVYSEDDHFVFYRFSDNKGQKVEGEAYLEPMLVELSQPFSFED